MASKFGVNVRSLLSTFKVLGMRSPNNTPANAIASSIGLTDTAGNGWYIWVDTSGIVRVAEAATVEAAAWNPNSDGTKVGTQT